jgi:protein-S-isoprenylcysteine O-methyltransferase Ste14
MADLNQILFNVMIFGYFILQLFWFLMDSRSISKKIKFHILLQGNVCSTIILIGFCLFVFIKFIDPSWMFSIRIESGLVNEIFGIGGFITYLIGMFLCVWARIIMGKSWAPAEDQSLNHEKVFIKNGPFLFTRNPIYLGLILIYSGFFISLKSYLIVVAIVIVLYFRNKAKEEETILEHDFDGEYLKYKSKVRRFL